jgi:hypothetical protein
MEASRKDRTRGWWVNAGHPVVLAAAVAVFARSHGAARDAVYAVVSLLPVVAVAVGVRLNRVCDRAPWYALAAALALLALPSAVEACALIWPGARGFGGPLNDWLHPIGYLALIVPCLLLIRHCPDSNGAPTGPTWIGNGLDRWILAWSSAVSSFAQMGSCFSGRSGLNLAEAAGQGVAVIVLGSGGGSVAKEVGGLNQVVPGVRGSAPPWRSGEVGPERSRGSGRTAGARPDGVPRKTGTTAP